MENFIYETMLDDVSVWDKLIEYHKNNTEQKRRGIMQSKTMWNNLQETDCILTLKSTD